MSCAAAAARCAASLVPFTAPLHLRPMSVAAGAGVLSPSAPARGILSFVCIPFQDSPRYGDLPVVKTKNPVSVQLFCDCGLSFVLSNQKRAADQPICCAFAPRYALWRPATIPNRKKVTIQGVFLFLGSQDSLERRSGMNLGPAREQGGPGSAAGDFGRALGGVPGCSAGRLWGRARWPASWSGTEPALSMRCLGSMPGV